MKKLMKRIHKLQAKGWSKKLHKLVMEFNGQYIYGFS